MDVKDWLRIHWDRALAWALVVSGVIALLFGWDAVAGSAFPAQQLPYLVSGGIGGGLMVVVGAALLVSADLRDEWHKLDHIEALLRDGAVPQVEPSAEPVPSESSGGDGQVVPLREGSRGRRLRATGS